MIHKTHLEARVAAQNIANAEAKRLQHEFVAFFKLYVGKKVLIAGNSFLKKLRPEIDAMLARSKERSGCHVNFSGYRDYSLSLEIRPYTEQYESYGGNVNNANVEASAYIATMQRENFNSTGIIEKVSDVNYNLRTDYTAAEVLANRADYKQKQAIADEAKSKLNPFGEYDR